MPKFNKPCPNCSAKVHVQQRVCKVCHTKLPLGWCKQELPTKGRPKHTNKASGYNLDKGRAKATTQEKRFKVGKSTGRPPSSKGVKLVMFQMCDLPDDWDTSEEYTNLTEDMLQQYRASVARQQRFDKKTLASALCYQCGKFLWSSVDGAHTFLVHPPEGM